MAILQVNHAAIRGVVSSIPKTVIANSYFEPDFSREEIESTSKMTGVFERRHADDNTCTSDLCLTAANQLLERLGWERPEVNLLIFVSQTPDYVLPATACILQNKLGLPKNCIAFDVNLGCSGYVYGLYLASKLLNSETKKALLLVGDTCSKFLSPKDRSTAMLFGDGGSATALEFDGTSDSMKFILGTDGGGYENLRIPAGGFRQRSSEDTLVRTAAVDGNLRGPEDLYMDGGEIFNFTLSAVPRLVKNLAKEIELDLATVDGFLFHQANEFMIKHIAKKLKLDLDKVPMTIGKYGNTSSASIPLTLTDWAHAGTNINLLMTGFGVGYSYGAVYCSGALEVCELIEHKVT